MTDTTTTTQLAGKCLIALPDMRDPRFRGSVILLCAASGEGAMGLIINRRADDVRLGDVMDQLEIPKHGAGSDMAIYFGGPVEQGRGFVLHSPEYFSDLSTIKVGDAFAMTATIDILEDIAASSGPEQAIVALGYSGWGPGQLEAEIAENGWLIADVGPEVIFNTPNAKKWSAALATLGIDPAILSSSGGNA